MPVLLRILVRICSRMLLLCRFCSGFSGFLISLPEQGMNLRSSSKDLSCRGRVILSSRSYCKCHLIQPPPQSYCSDALPAVQLWATLRSSQMPVLGCGGVWWGRAGGGWNRGPCRQRGQNPAQNRAPNPVCCRTLPRIVARILSIAGTLPRIILQILAEILPRILPKIVSVPGGPKRRILVTVSFLVGFWVGFWGGFWVGFLSRSLSVRED